MKTGRGKTDAQWRAYGNLPCIMERLPGGGLDPEGEGRNTVWKFRLYGEVFKELPATGNHNLPELDQFYKLKPGVKNPTTWDDYSDDLIDGGEEKFLAWLGPQAQLADLRQKLDLHRDSIGEMKAQLQRLLTLMELEQANTGKVLTNLERLTAVIGAVRQEARPAPRVIDRFTGDELI
jgi:hypothetical protein